MKRSILLIAILSLATFGSADWVIGSGRFNGMGRAGLALPGDYIYSGKLNPAMYGLAPSNFRFLVPRFSFRLDGVGVNDLQDFFGDVNSGGLDENKLADIARKLGDSNFEFGAGTGLGIYFNGFALDFEGDALVAGLPNQQLQTWVNSGSNGNVPIGSRLDAYGLGGYQVGFGYGRRLNTSGEMDLSIGARVKIVKSYYTHRFADANSIQNNTAGALAPEMGGNDTLSENGLGLDLGIVASASKDRGLFIGATFENLLVPKTTFNGTSPTLTTSTIRPYPRTFNTGIGYVTPGKYVFAADFIDAFNGASAQELRVGSELLLGGFALRGGYESRSGFTIGAGFGGFNLAFGGNTNAALSYALRF
ncbi:MAG: conjugal transfer protein TraF [Fimbriimonadaceae bacterium]